MRFTALLHHVDVDLLRHDVRYRRNLMSGISSVGNQESASRLFTTSRTSRTAGRKTQTPETGLRALEEPELYCPNMPTARSTRPRRSRMAATTGATAAFASSTRPASTASRITGSVFAL